MKPRGVVFLDGRYLPASQARVSVFDRGLLFGDGAFETVRCYGTSPFSLAAHLERLEGTASRIGIPIRFPEPTWRRRFGEIVRRNHLERDGATVRLTITRGPDSQGMLPPADPRPTVLLTARPLDPRIPRLQRRGADVVLLPFHPGVGGLLSGEKTLLYLTAVLGKERALRRGAFEGIYMSGNEILEGTTSNLFVARNGILSTPPLEAGVLPGITRRTVIALARDAGIRVRERKLRVLDLTSADEAFLTASIIEVIPVRRVGKDCLRLVRGPLTRAVQAGYERLCGATNL